MITIGTVKFDFRMDNEGFARELYARWDRFFQTSFEAVAEEVMATYDYAGEVLTIDSLPIDIGVLSEEDFDEHFPTRLREILNQYFYELSLIDGSTTPLKGVQRLSKEKSILDILCFFLMHGYLPHHIDNEWNDLGKLLHFVLQTASDGLREFLESYAHYDFLYKRLVFQFSDEQLEAIVDKVHPSEAKFIHLYTRIQIRSYALNQSPEIAFADYRNAVWILVLAYLFHENGSRFSRKQLILHTLRGLSARFNLSFVELTRMLSDRLDELEKNTVNLPELWAILKEIRKDIHGELLHLDGNYLKYAYREITDALRMVKKEENEHLLTPENLAIILSDPESCRELLRQLYEPEIYRLVECIVPQESEFIISYARLLDQHEEHGYFTGKVGQDFRLIKWEFIFMVIYRAPLSYFNRTNFIRGVIQQLAAHYNLSVNEVIRFLLSATDLHNIFIVQNILPILIEWLEGNSTPGITLFPGTLPALGELSTREEIMGEIKLPEQDIYKIVRQIIPTESEFIISYAQLLDKHSERGLFEGKAGGDFRMLKWKFIFACLPIGNNGITFRRKYFVYDVIKQLAAHFNQNIIDLLLYFYKEFAVVGPSSSYVELANVLNQLYQETLLSLSHTSATGSMTKENVEEWIIYLFGSSTSGSGALSQQLERWLIYSLDQQNDVFCKLWKSAKLDESLIFSILRHNEKLMHLFIRRIGDVRLLKVYQVWMKHYQQINHHLSDFTFLQQIKFYLSLWIVQLTARRYAAWSVSEIECFLSERLRSSIPSGMVALFDQTNKSDNRSINQIIEMMNANPSNLANKPEAIQVQNAGLILLYPYYSRLFRLCELTSSNSYEFKDREAQLKAIFLLQYVAYGDRRMQFEEQELTLNKIIVNWESGPLPKEYLLTEKDKTTVNDMINAVKTNWSKMKNTSINTFREVFLERCGLIKPSDDERFVYLEVEEKAYDLLLDSLPWSLSMLRLFNSDKLLKIKWRSL